MAQLLSVTLLNVLLCLLLSTASADYSVKYYMDSALTCQRSDPVTLGYGTKLTLLSKNYFGGTNYAVCQVTLSSPTGAFKVDFDGPAYISDCGVKLSIYTGSDENAPLHSVYTCGSFFYKDNQYIPGQYLTFRLERKNLLSRDYQFEADITASGAILNSRSFHLSTGILVSIIISALLTVLCIILVPLGVCCYMKRRRRRNEGGVIYTAPPTNSVPGGYSGAYGRPTYH